MTTTIGLFLGIFEPFQRAFVAVAIAIRRWLVQQLDQRLPGGDKQGMIITFKPVRLAKVTILLIAVFAMSGIPGVFAQTQGTGLPLPRYVSLRAAEVNLRTGPGVQYPVEWIFQRESLPVEIIKEYRTWRLVRDWEGTQGWMHQSMLSGKRTFLITGKDRTIRAEPDARSRAIAVVAPNVIGEITSCPSGTGWCQVRIKGIEGWLRRVEFWGVYRNEVFE